MNLHKSKFADPLDHSLDRSLKNWVSRRSPRPGVRSQLLEQAALYNQLALVHKRSKKSFAAWLGALRLAPPIHTQPAISDWLVSPSIFLSPRVPQVELDYSR